MNKFCLALLMSCLLGSDCLADNGFTLAARQEVMRRGHSVEHVSGGYESSIPEAYHEAAKPPADDSHKWFFTVFTAPHCGACEKLEAAFSDDDALKAWVDKSNPKDSFVHYHEIKIQDPTQGWRWGKLSGNRFPVLIIQPPLNGKYGDPKTALPPIEGFTSGADEAEKIRQTCKAYLDSTLKTDAQAKDNRKPPFDWPDSPGEDPKKILQLTTKETKPMNDIQSAGTTILTVLMSQGGFQLMALLGLTLWLGFRNHMKLLGKTLWLDDATYNEIVQIIQRRANIVSQ
jgi:hypothetical protein